MTDKDKKNTEEKILEAAKSVFVKKGKAGARMQEIADEAGINKSLLHYYYRSKDKLFNAVFKFAISVAAPKVFGVFSSETSAFDAIDTFIGEYLNLLRKHPFIPMFILGEVHKRESHFVLEVFRNSGINISAFSELIERDKAKGLIKEDVNPKYLLINIISLCVFPFIGRPLLETMVFENDSNQYDTFLEERKQQVTTLIFQSIKKD